MEDLSGSLAPTVPKILRMTTTDMRQGRCPGCGASEIHEVEVPPRVGGELMLRLQDTFSVKAFPLQTLICAQCGRVQQHLSLTEKQRKLLNRALIRKIHDDADSTEPHSD
ncbi:hypothetical protein ACZ90_45860 [Streptomyces albus subsp. albus]|nr:hypothetical protein ACZ90_45860 [Streptomyces albus subsp. albus]